MIKKIRQYLYRSENKKNDQSSSYEEDEIIRLNSIPRYNETSTKLLGFEFKIPDGPSFIETYKEVFKKNIYKFQTTAISPVIIDCGANVGVSCVYFKRVYPQCRLIAFEPDPIIFNYLEDNIKSGEIKNIELIQKAVWSCNTELEFYSEKSDAGRLNVEMNAEKITVQTTRLKDYLKEQVDFLKIDIEGAETEVILDSKDLLKNVQNIFIEYHSFKNNKQTLSNILEKIQEAGFRYQIQPMLYSQRPFIKIDEYMGMDLQLNIFGYR